MLQLKTKKELSQEAHTLAKGHSLIRYHSNTYIPVDYETDDTQPPIPPERTVWMPMTKDDVQQVAAANFRTLFGTEGELSSFDFMVAQNATPYTVEVDELLVRTTHGLRRLTAEGKLEEPTGGFVPNTLVPVLNDDPDLKTEVFNVIVEWLGSEEEARSLLRHLATCLAPHYSAVKYVLLLGEGRNGKGTLLKMLQDLFGIKNASHVTRQHMAENSSVLTELNGKLLNLVMDGQAAYLKDSGTEKSLVAGEPVAVRELYRSQSTIVQTNALFVEALNREPKSGDKSSALQKRLVRFQFPNVYDLDHAFERKMRSPDRLGAFLALLVDHYVTADQVAVMLAPTAKAVELQLEHMVSNSLGLQFLSWYAEQGDITDLFGESMEMLASRFRAWRTSEMDFGSWSSNDVLHQFQPVLTTERKSVREAGVVSKVRVVTGLKPEAHAYLQSLKGDPDEAHTE